MKQIICVSRTKANSYIKVTLPNKEKENIGCIQHNGVLNVKPILTEMISAAGGDFLLAPDWRPAVKGRTRNRAGTGYHSNASFQRPLDARQYLEQFFDVYGEI